MSPYSSIFRKSVWGGVPISLPAMAVFMCIAGLAGIILVTRAEQDRSALLTLLGLCAAPVGATLVMGSIAAFQLHAACKQCIGIYTSSLVAGTFALLALRSRVRVVGGEPQNESAGRRWTLAFPLAAVLVIVPMTGYVMAMPSYAPFEKGCGSLPSPDDKHGVLVHVKAEAPDSKPAIEVFDPLCPACKAFEERMRGAGLDKRLDRQLLLFPLDNTCNWMIDNAMHPGSCAVSAAVLCAGDRAKDVIDWAFDQQTPIHDAMQTDKNAAARMVGEKFPDLKACMDSAVTKARLAQSLRWAVKNQLPVLTPQLYVSNKRLCDEDTDLGLEYTLTRMLQGGS
ncbi:MAG TPA: vitamin K epoxide reductase family protein, partial [Polyangiales bacterium]|jgi:hypothetical protein|nr:vitamin K epoxide reductase family protein [Polyangiales bacterium]